MIESFVLFVLYFLEYASPVVILILIIFAIYLFIKCPICPICGRLSDYSNENEAECSTHGKFYVNGSILKKNLKIVLYWSSDSACCKEIINFLEYNKIVFEKKNIKRSKYRKQLEIKTHRDPIIPIIVINNKIMLSETSVFKIRKKLKDLGVKKLELT